MKKVVITLEFDHEDTTREEIKSYIKDLIEGDEIHWEEIRDSKELPINHLIQKGGAEAGLEAQLLFYPVTEQLFVKILHYPDPADY